MITASCPSCHSDVIVGDEAYENDLVTCANCGSDLEIISLSPLKFQVISDEDIDEENPVD